MKVLLLNGSPRKGNTYTALEALKRGFKNIDNLELKEINADDVSVSPCIACEACGCDSQCVFDDDTNDVINAVAAADVIVFASPVYWWGVTAQLKVIIDKFFSQYLKMTGMNKKVGFIAIGEAEQGDIQYDLLEKQFECICEYLKWDMAFAKNYTAAGAGELAKNAEAIAELEGLWESIK